MASRNKAARFDWLLIAALALALPVMALTPLLHTPFGNQLPGTNDAELHLHRLISAALNLRNGIIWPRWSPALHFGFGYPINNFYDPGWHVAGAFLMIAGMPAVTVELLAQAIGIVLYPVGAYLFGRLIAGRPGALLSAAIFLYAPFRFYELLEQGNISQFIAMALIPWVLWAIGRCAQQPSVRRVAFGGLLMGLLVVMHHPTAFAFLPFAALYALLIGFVPPADPAIRRRSRISAPIAALAIGVVISAIYWLPALTELKNVRVSQAATGLYDVQANFVSLAELLGPTRTLDRAALNAPRPFNVGQPGLIFAALGVVAGLWPRTRLTRWQRAHLISAAVVIIGCLYLMTDQSAWLWALFPPAQAIQFPWRLMGIVTAATIPGAAIAIDVLPQRWRASGALIGLLLAILVALPAMPPIQPNVLEPANPTPGDSIRYEAASGNLGAVATYEYTPRWSTERPLFDPCTACYDNWDWFIRVDQASVPAGVTITAAKGSQPGATQFQVKTSNTFNLTLHQFYFPGWQITIDGATAPIHITTPYGLMAIAVPAGTHTIDAWYAGTLEQHIGDASAVLGLILCGVLLLIDPIRTRFKRRAAELSIVYPSGTVDPRRYRRLAIGVTSLAVAFTPVATPVSEAFRADGSPVHPIGASMMIHRVYRNSAGTPLLELVGADLPSQVRPGERVTAQLYWHALQPLQAGWHIALKMQDSLQTADWVSSDNAVPGGFATNTWPSDKYVVDTHSFVVPSDTLPYVDDLIATIYDDAGDHLNTDSPVLATVRVNGTNCLPGTILTGTPVPSPHPVNVHFGDALTLSAYTLDRNAGQATLTLNWQVDSAPSNDLALFIHEMNGKVQVGNADNSPIETYPSHEWQPGQCLTRQLTLNIPGSADRLLIGFYRRSDGERLTAAGNAPIEDNGLLIPLTSP